MDDILKFVATVQNSGGMLIVFTWLVFEVRQQRKDFHRHEKIYHGVDA